MTWANRIGFFLMFAVVVFTTMAYGAVHQPVIAVFYLIVTVMAILWAVDGIRSGAVRFDTDPVQLVLLAGAAYGLVQAIPFGTVAEVAGVPGIPRTISLEPFATQVSALHFFALFVFLACSLVLVDSATRIRRTVTVLMIFGFGYAFYAILQGVLSPDKIYGIYESKGAASFGSFVNRHNFAAFMEMAVALPLGLVFSGAIVRDKRLLYLTTIALMGVALLLSGSRGGFVALVAEVILLVIMTTGSKGRRELALKVALVIVLIGAIIGGAVFVGGETSLTRFAETAQRDDITTGRTHIWKLTLDVISSNMPLGAGLGAYRVAYTRHDTMSGLERVEQAHNDYLQVLADAGLVGLVIGAFFLFLMIRQGMRISAIRNTFRRGVAVGAFAGIFAVLVHSIFDFVLHTTAISVMFLLLITLLVASRKEYEDDVREFEPHKQKKRRSSSVAAISSSVRSSR